MGCFKVLKISFRKLHCTSGYGVLRMLSWEECAFIEGVFQRRECAQFVPSITDSQVCCCGRLETQHDVRHLKPPSPLLRTWTMKHCTVVLPTNAYGTIEFSRIPSHFTAQYVRLDSNTQPQHILELMQKVWKVKPPGLVISIHQGKSDFFLPSKLAAKIRKGLAKVSMCTNAWVFTSGLDNGVVRYLSSFAEEGGIIDYMQQLTLIGVAPWGVVSEQCDLIGQNAQVKLMYKRFSISSSYRLNDQHTHFILVDDGTIGKMGSEMALRIDFEGYLRKKFKLVNKKPPLVSVVINGDEDTIRYAYNCVSVEPRIPMVICEGSGRASDIISFSYRMYQENGLLNVPVKLQIVERLHGILRLSEKQSTEILPLLLYTASMKQMINIFLMFDQYECDFDTVILLAVLRICEENVREQLLLAMTWNRVDMAANYIFTKKQKWSDDLLEKAMLAALKEDNVNFVKLFLDNGLYLNAFLTIDCLERLYNSTSGPNTVFEYVMEAAGAKQRPDSSYRLIDIGEAIERLMGTNFRSQYCTHTFRMTYKKYMEESSTTQALKCKPMTHLGRMNERRKYQRSDYLLTEDTVKTGHFEQPYSELFLWAVLTVRPNLLEFTWERCDHVLAECLVAEKLLYAMITELEQAEIDSELLEALNRKAEHFRSLAVELLDQCYRRDHHLAVELLTQSLDRWSGYSCLALAVRAGDKAFLSHRCCQRLLDDLWHGGIRAQKNTIFQVLDEMLKEPQARENLERMTNEYGKLVKRSDFHVPTISSEMWTKRRTSPGRKNEKKKSTDNYANGIIGTAQEWLPANCESYPETYYTDFRTEEGFSTGRKDVNTSTLSLSQKIYEFYISPITTFWLWVLSYIVFLCFFTYIVAMKLQPTPFPTEWYLLVYNITRGLDMLRLLFTTKVVRFHEKFTLFFCKFWNAYDTIMISTFFVAFGLRFNMHTLHLGRVLYACNIFFCYVRLLDFLCVSRHIGHYIVMLKRMVFPVFCVTLILIVFIASYGVLRQSILDPIESWNRKTMENIFYRPFVMLHGKVFEEELEICSKTTEHCLTGENLIPTFAVLYLMVANTVVLSFIVAVMSNKYEESKKGALQSWMFHRYDRIVEYHMKPFLPPPLTAFWHIYLIIQYFCYYSQWKLDRTLRPFLNGTDAGRLKAFEKSCTGNLIRAKELQRIQQMELETDQDRKRYDVIMMKMEDIGNKSSEMFKLLRVMVSDEKPEQHNKENVISGAEDSRTKFLQKPVLKSVHPFQGEGGLYGDDYRWKKHPGKGLLYSTSSTSRAGDKSSQLSYSESTESYQASSTLSESEVPTEVPQQRTTRSKPASESERKTDERGHTRGFQNK
uniref:LSDAT_euk domain-containing protein n=1 Tax=Trichuris muris TaxID=70415 RepID=A0A5S6Q8S9_TRIMR